MQHRGTEANSRGLTRLAALGLVAALTAACAREAQVNSGPAQVGQAGPDSVSGLVRQVGNAPFMQTIVVGDDTVIVTGPYKAEITRLVGAHVRITGRIESGSGLGTEMVATSYEILDVDGVRPLVGTLVGAGVEYLLQAPDGSETRLLGVSDRLAGMVGGRVWVVLSDASVVIRYGILREPDGT